MDRLLHRLSSVAIGYQRWDEALFLHWPVPADTLRRAVDPRLELDAFDGRCFLSLIPFTVLGARLRATPAVPFVSDFHELNLRTYVVARGGEPGVWFFSLDAASAVASAVARASLGLPYFVARMRRTAEASSREFHSERVVVAGRRPSAHVRWTVAERAVAHPPGSLESFLVDRYALYSRNAGRLLRMRVRHAPWPLVEARIEQLNETVTLARDLPPAPLAPMAHFSSGVDVEFFPPELVA